jgi:formate hydrogenlyase transcriptional activator
VLRRATILEDGDELALADFDAAAGATPPPAHAHHWHTLDEHERIYIEEVLRHLGGVIEGAKGAARILGVPPSTLRSRMKRLGITLGKGRAR